MAREFLRTGTLRELVLDVPGIAAIVSAIAFIALRLMTGTLALVAVERAVLPVIALALSCLIALGSMSRIDDDDFVLYLKASGTYNTLELQFAYYKAVSLLAIAGPVAFYAARSVNGPAPLQAAIGAYTAATFVWCIAGTFAAFRTRQKYQMLRDEMLEIVGPRR